ncbi:MAG: DUF2953 domain-containing protein [Clostridia bacterium]
MLGWLLLFFGICMLPVRIRGRMDYNREPTILLQIETAGLHMQYDGLLERDAESFRITFRRRGHRPKTENPFSFSWSYVQKGLRLFQTLPEIRQMLRRHIEIENLDLCCRIGVADAAYTAILAGALSACACFFSLRALKKTPHHVQVVPDYTGAKLLLGVQCIIRFRVGDVILVGTQTLYAILQARVHAAWQRRIKKIASQ